MPLTRTGQLAIAAVFAGWFVWEQSGRPDPVITGAVVAAPPAERTAPADAQSYLQLAQAIPPEVELEPADDPEAVAQDVPDVDESALRYFARQGDTRRLDAEIARLRALYPGWQPPANPAAPIDYSDPELDRMWELFSERDYAEVRAMIAARLQREPDWRPPVALTDLLDQAEAQVRLTNASDSGQWRAVIQIAADTPALLTCAYVDTLWRLAEAFAKTDKPDRALDVYTYILSNCTDEAERQATVQKAADNLSPEAVTTLYAYQQGDEFQPVTDLLIRRRIGAIAESEAGVATPTDLERLEILAESGDSAEDALLLGWYYYRRDNPTPALDWFRKARSRDPESIKAVEGETLALIALDRFAEAETVGYDWNEASDDNLAAYLIAVVDLLGLDPPPRLSEPVLQRMATVVLRVRNLQGGEQFGWYAYNLGQVDTAQRWFETVLRWDPEFEPAAYGLAVVLLAQNQKTRAQAIIDAWAARSERIRELGGPVTKAKLRGPSYVVDAPVYATPDATVTTVPAARSTAVATGSARVSSCGGTAPVESLSPAAAVRRGWCLMDLNRPVEAVAAFEIGARSTSAKVRSDAAYGLSLANLRNGVTSQAAVAAAAAAQDTGKRRELSESILTQQALAAYADGRYVETILLLDERSRFAPEQTDLMVLKGFAYLNVNRLAEAKRLFQAAAGSGNQDAIRGLATVQERQNGLY